MIKYSFRKNEILLNFIKKNLFFQTLTASPKFSKLTRLLNHMTASSRKVNIATKAISAAIIAPIGTIMSIAPVPMASKTFAYLLESSY